MHFGNQTQRWDGGTADYWQRGVLHAGVSRSTANTPYSYTPFPHREGGNWSSLHIGYADTGVPGTGLKPALTPFRSPLTPASATWVSSLSTQTGNPAHANISVIGGARPFWLREIPYWFDARSKSVDVSEIDCNVHVTKHSTNHRNWGA